MAKPPRAAPADSAATTPLPGGPRAPARHAAADPDPSVRRIGIPLTRDRVVAAALALVDADGLSGLSTRKLGLALGCEAMSIYHHFASKQHLLDALVDAALASVPPPPAHLPAIDRLREQAYAWRAMAHRHPRLYPLVAVHRLNTPTGVRLLERMLAIVAEVTADAEAAARGFRVLGYYVTGAALDETAGYARGPSAAQPVDDAFIARECPHLAAAAPYARPGHWDRTFALGLDAVIAGIVGGGTPSRGDTRPAPKPVIHPKR
jgi:AcrR family transcriptional regulator